MTKPTLIDRAFVLKKAFPFANLDLELLLAIADKLEIATLKADQKVFNIDDEESSHMYFILQGDIRIENEQNNTLEILSEGNFFGDEALFADKPRQYAAISIDNSKILALSRSNLLTILSECPSIAIGFLKQYAQNLPYNKK